MIIQLNEGNDYLVYEVRRGANTVEIIDIAVNTERRKGIGRQLVQILINTMRDEQPYQLYVLTRRSNEVARGFYLGIGFSQLTVLADFYLDKDREDPTIVTREDAVMYGRVVE